MIWLWLGMVLLLYTAGLATGYWIRCALEREERVIPVARLVVRRDRDYGG